MAFTAGIPIYDASVTGVTELLQTGYTILESAEVENINTTPVYLQLFDAAATTDVTLGTTTPTDTRMIPAGAGTPNNTARLFGNDIRRRFGAGIVYAITTTRSGSTSPATACPVNFVIS